MKKTTVLLIVFMFFCFVLVKGQTNILVYSETFESGAPGVLLNTPGAGANTGNNTWIINDIYNGAPTYPNTTDESVTSGGTISFAPYSKYLHIHDQASGILNCNYNPTTASDRFVQLTSGFCTQGMSDVKLTFFYICQGSPTAYGEVYYSVDNGPWISTGNQYSNQTTWQYTIIQNPAFNNVQNLRIGFRWVNNAGSLPGAMSFGIDDIFVTGYFDNFVTNFNVVVDSVTPNPICQNFGLLIYYHLTVPICGAGFFEVQLSNAAGSFTAATSLGIYQASNSYMNGILWPTIPSTTPAGTCYKIRIHYYFTDYALNFYSNTSVCIEVQQCPNTINTLQPVVTKGGDSLCIGSVIDIPFYSTGVFQNSNSYIAQLSDSTGAFSGNLNVLGSNPDHNSYDPALGSPPGSVSGLVNQNNQPIPDGCNYYIRIISTNPATTGLQWGPFCIKHCDIESNHKHDLHACLTSTQGYSTTVYANIHYWDSTGNAAIYDPANNHFMMEVHSSQTFAVIPPVGGIGNITASNDTTLVVTLPNATQLGTLGLAPGLYYVRIIATNSNHPWDIDGTIIRLLIGAPADSLWILQSPSDSVLCVGDAVYFYPIPYNAGPPMNSTYQWYLNGPLFSTNPALGILFNGAGNYHLTVRETNYGCAGPLTPNSVTLHVLAPPTASIIGPLQVCLGDTIYYNATFHNDIYYEWTNSGGAIIDTSNNELYIRWDTAGIYTIDLLCLNKCGQALGHISVIVTPHPDASFSAIPLATCTGDSIDVHYTGTTTPPLIYNWNFDGGIGLPGGSSPGPHHVAWSTPGQHYVTLDISKYSCHTYDSMLVAVTQMPTPKFSVQDGCLGFPSIFADSSQGNPAMWAWNFGDGSAVSTQANPVHTYASPGSYNVQLIVTNGICSDSVSHTVVIAQKSTSIFTAVNPVCFGETCDVSYTGNASPGAVFTWDFGGGSIVSGSGQGPYVISWADSGSHVVSLSIMEHACGSDTSKQSIEVRVCKLTIPNIITPNGDGKNDVFKILGLEAFPLTQVMIFNRWGNLIYKSDDYQNSWDGGDHPDGVYYYLVSTKDGTKYHGSVTVLR